MSSDFTALHLPDNHSFTAEPEASVCVRRVFWRSLAGNTWPVLETLARCFQLVEGIKFSLNIQIMNERYQQNVKETTVLMLL